MMFVLLVLIGYLIGSIPSGYISMRLFTGQDIRTFGTGNATVTAVMIYGGKRPGIAALLLEIIKVVICIFIAGALVGEVWASLTILIAAVFGCSWSVWLRGGGGQGLTIGMSGLVLLNVVAVLIMAVFYLVPYATTKRHLMSNRIFRISVPIVLGSWYASWEWALAGCLLVMPSFVKGWLSGDDVVEARKADSVGHTGAGAV
jgi:glycerol-3-phosphate acyltransferase PlsY